MSRIRICNGCLTPLPPDAPACLCPACSSKADTTRTLAISPDAFGSPGTPVQARLFGDYELLEEIARGGMGVVWKARQRGLNRMVALKMILAGTLAGEDQVQRFRREAEAAANLQHPNIVAIHEVGQREGQHFYSMDYIEGRDLGTVVSEGGPLPPARAAECVQTLAEAVHFAHQRGTLHRDLKPQNVLIDAAGLPRITDFGLAKFIEREDNLTMSGAAMGSPSYMPPEQAAGRLDQLGPHSDVYSLGAILYELLTGRPPFRAESAMSTMRQVMESEATAPRKLNAGVPPDLETICLKCLEKNPAQRYHSARALAEDLGRFLKHEPIEALPFSALRKTESWVRRHPWTLMTAASLALMVLIGLLYWQHERIKFLENGPAPTGQTLGGPGWRGQEIKQLSNFSILTLFITEIALAVFLLYRRRSKGWKLFFERTDDLGPTRSVSQPLRVVCGMISVAGLGFALVVLVKIIQANVWESRPFFENSSWFAYLSLFVSLVLLIWVARDYQRFVHGISSRALPAEQTEPLRQAIFHGDSFEAITLYRRIMPDASQDEARDFVRKLAAELKAKQPEKFAPPAKMWDLNWPRMGVCLVAGLVLFAGVWMVVPPVRTMAVALACMKGFFIGAGLAMSVRLKVLWQRVLIYLLYLILVIRSVFPYNDTIIYASIAAGTLIGSTIATAPWRRWRLFFVCLVMTGIVAFHHPDAGSFLAGLALGTGTTLNGFVRKRGQLAQASR
jgi:serine/threonine protein kinase